MSIIDPKNMPHKCSTFRQVASQSGQLGTSLTMAVRNTKVRCWVQLASQREIADALKRKKSVTHKVYFSSNDPQLREGDAIRITHASTKDQSIVGLELRYQVRADGSAGVGILFKYLFEEFQLPHVGASE